MKNLIKKIFLRHKINRNNSSVGSNKKLAREKTTSRITSLLPFMMVLLLIFSIILLFPRGKSYEFGDLKENDVYIGEEVIAPFSFAINKSKEEYNQHIEDAKRRIYPVFVRNDSIAEQQVSLLMNFFLSLKDIRDSSKIKAVELEAITNLLKASNITISDDNLFGLLQNGDIYISSSQKKTSSKKSRKRKILNSSAEIKTFDSKIIQVCRSVFESGVLNVKKKEIKPSNAKISVRGRGQEIIEELDYYYDMEETQSVVLLEKLEDVFPDNKNLVKVGYQILIAFIKPNVRFDKAETESRIEQAINSVPLAKGMVLEKERIIDNHQKVTREHVEKLRSLAQAKAEREEFQGGYRVILPYIGKFLLIAISLMLLFIFIITERQELLRSFKKLFLIHLIILFTLFLTFLINKLGLSPNLIPITIASMLLTIFFDTRIGFIGTIAISIIMGGLRGNDFNVVIISIFAGSIAVLPVSKVRTRHWLVKSILWIVSSYIISISALELLRFTPFNNILVFYGYGILNGILSPILVYGLITIIELTFDMTTDMTLLELSDLNHPILKEMAMKASGTYFHSILIGNLSEAAAEAIGANSLLARVGAYYHDIGKIQKSGYFIENQNRGINPHERLSPHMSFLILANHVRGGLELAKKYKLPNEIQAFIAEHHGTSLTNIFYQKALQQKGEKEVNESDFRYPGPKPQTKETAIVMLADAVEAASRSLKDPTVSRIKGMVNFIIRERFRQSELDDCPLTLRDLNKIGESFQKIIIGIFHARIEYPDQEEKVFKKSDRKLKEKILDPSN